MTATLDPMVTQYVWVCSNCKTRFHYSWRPLAENVRILPPNPAYQWTADRPTYRYCPMCGAKFVKESACGEETCEL